MVPLKLTVKNFMCYRDRVPTLDFEGLHVACLCGDNGHGKTALLDSITWALWGQARARTQDELVHQGRTDMSVDLEFLARGQRYRVNRRYSRSGRSRGATILELQVSSGNGFQPITGDSVRQTEARIRDILHMDYDTFVNTAFLLQGRADMFTRSRPAERKQVLAEVLDLSYYESLEARALDRGRELRGQIQSADGDITMRREELSLRPGYRARLTAVEAALAGLAPELESARRDGETVRERVNELRGIQLEVETLARRVAEGQEQIADLERRARDNEARLNGYGAVTARSAEIRERFSMLEAARVEVGRLDQASFAAADLERERADLDRTIAVQRQHLSSRADQLRMEIENELEPKASRLSDIEEEHHALTERQSGMEVLEATIGRRRDEVLSLGSELDRLGRTLELRQGLEPQKAALEREIAVQRERLSARAEQLRDRIDRELEPGANRLRSIQEELSLAALDQENLGRLADTLGNRRGEAEEVAGRLEFLNQANEDLLRQMEETRSKFDMLDLDGAECPVCKQPLGPEGQEHLRSEYEEQGQQRKSQYESNTSAKSALEARREELVDEITRLDADHQTKQREAQAADASLQRDLEDARAAGVELPSAVAALERAERDLDTGDFGHEQRAEAAGLEEKLAVLDYDPDRRAEIQDEITSANAEISHLDQELDEARRDVQGRAITLWSELEEAKRASAELGPRRSALQETMETLSAQDFAHAARTELSVIQERLSELGYDAGAHRRLQEEARELEPYAGLDRQLREALESQPGERRALDEVEQGLRRRREDIAADQARQEELAEELEALPGLEAGMPRARRNLEGLEERERDALADKKFLVDRIAALAELGKQVDRLEQQRRKLQDENSVYDELSVAFGVNGIQALIIESAIPQLNQDANELLGRLTDHGLSLKLQLREGRRERRIGVPSEELEIMIGDEWGGTRSYETFSGGEAFRIDFALRIGLSKLLARRSGAPLPILFIDEGFGSQDAAGQERLRETIQSVQSDFEKIVVITHVEHIKESFPVRIEVTKTPEGSTFTVT